MLLSRALHCQLSQTPSCSCPGAAENIWTSGCAERRALTKPTGDTHTFTHVRYTCTQRHTLCIYTRGKYKAPKLHEIFFCSDSSLPNGKGLKRSLSNTKTESANQDGAPPDYLLPGSSERPLMALLPHSSQPEVRTVNTWNLFKHWASSPRHTQ